MVILIRKQLRGIQAFISVPLERVLFLLSEYFGGIFVAILLDFERFYKKSHIG